MRSTLLTLMVAALAAVALALLPAPPPQVTSKPATTTWTAGIETSPLPSAALEAPASATPQLSELPLIERTAGAADPTMGHLPSSTELQGIGQPTAVLALMANPNPPTSEQHFGGLSANEGAQKIVTEPTPELAQAGPQGTEEAADPFKVYDPIGGAGDDPHKVFERPSERNYDPFKVYDDPMAFNAPDTAHLGEELGSDSQAEPHRDGVILGTDDLGATAFEPHVDGKRPVPAGLSPTEANEVPQADLTNTLLAEHVGTHPPAEDLYSETQTDAPAKPWLGPGTDTRE
jgi:hypothetical protein